MKSHHHAHVPFNGVRHDGANMYPHLAVFYTHLDFFLGGGNSLPPFRPLLRSIPPIPLEVSPFPCLLPLINRPLPSLPLLRSRPPLTGGEQRVTNNVIIYMTLAHDGGGQTLLSSTALFYVVLFMTDRTADAYTFQKLTPEDDQQCYRPRSYSQ